MQTAIQSGVLAALVCFCVDLAAVFAASPTDYVKSPIIEEAEREIDVKAGTGTACPARPIRWVRPSSADSVSEMDARSSTTSACCSA